MGSDRIFSRLDRAMGNDEWMMQYGQLVLDYKLPHISDHSLMHLDMKLQTSNTKTPFRFFNVWAKHKDFDSIVHRSWSGGLQGNKLRCIWHKLKELKPQFKELNDKKYRGAIERIQHIRNTLKLIQLNLSKKYTDSMVQEEKELLIQLEKWINIEESIHQQKFRAMWIKLGDSNNKYFTAMIKERRHKKHIVELNSLAGAKLVEPAEIQKEIITFYQTLMGTAKTNTTAVSRTIMRTGPNLSHTQQMALSIEVTEKEIYDGLCFIGDDKAPEVDGYNAIFFKKA
ncbi:hypothetical protein KY285_033389 [Solanum tuberosum]|nr:hypothetical protein KY285_033389 [Solanum tuberosum]